MDIYRSTGSSKKGIKNGNKSSVVSVKLRGIRVLTDFVQKDFFTRKYNDQTYYLFETDFICAGNRTV
jgi:hypothetical protein